MPATRARTRAATAASGTLQGKQPGITSFARAGKPGAGLSAAAKSSKGRNDAVGTAAVEKPPATARVEKQERAGEEKELIRAASSGKKRKLGESSVGEGKDDAVDGDDSASASASAVDVTKDSAQYQPTTHEPKRKVSRRTQSSPARTQSLRPRTARAVSSSQPSPSTATPTPAKSPAKTPTRSLRQSPLKFNGKDEGPGSSLPVSGVLGEQSTQETGVTEPEPESDDDEEEDGDGDGAQSVHESVRKGNRLDGGSGHEDGSVDGGVVSKGTSTSLEGSEAADTPKAPDGDQREESEVAAPTHLEANPPTPTDTEGETPETRQEHQACDVPLEKNDLRPESYHDLISLHASFLTALSFHYAHNNSSAPADLTELLPSIEKIWKKRSVSSDDLRRVLYIINSSSVGEEEDKAGQQGSDEGTSKQIRIANYGPGKTCLELLGDRKKNAFAPPTNDEKLTDEFCVKLERFWVQQQKDSQSPQPASSAFQKAVPLEPIHDSTTNFTTPRIGRQRVLDFTQGTLKLRSLQSANSTFSDSAARARRSSRLTSTRSPSGATARKSSLLERIRAKQEQAAQLPPPPTPEEALRMSARDHLEEVKGVLGCMRPPQTTLTPLKRAYTWETVVENVVNSLKVPVERELVGACLDMLANGEGEGLNWVRIVEAKGAKNVVLTSGGLKGWISFGESKAGAGRVEKKNVGVQQAETKSKVGNEGV